MRQVPSTTHSYLVFGRGKLATHLYRYLNLCGCQVQQWHRGQNQQRLRELLVQSNLVLLCISDSAIAEVYKQLRAIAPEKTFLHFSGSVEIEAVLNFHPLFSFSATVLTREQYQAIPFAHFRAEDQLSDYFPPWTNPQIYIAATHKQHYHALLASAGNLAQWLWQQVAQEAEPIGLAAQNLEPLLRSSLENWLELGQAGISGPISRRDQNSILSNIDHLQSPALKKIYATLASYHTGENYVAD